MKRYGLRKGTAWGGDIELNRMERKVRFQHAGLAGREVAVIRTQIATKMQ